MECLQVTFSMHLGTNTWILAVQPALFLGSFAAELEEQQVDLCVV